MSWNPPFQVDFLPKHSVSFDNHRKWLCWTMLYLQWFRSDYNDYNYCAMLFII